MNAGKAIAISLLCITLRGSLMSQNVEFNMPPAPSMQAPAAIPTADTTSASSQNNTSAPKEAGTEKTVEPSPAPQNAITLETTNIGISPETRQKIALMLNKLLVDEYVLYTKTLKYHWNVTGIAFHDFHQAFKEQYEQLFDIVDAVAERARALGALALDGSTESSLLTRLKEITTDKLSAIDMVKRLLEDHEKIIRSLRENAKEVSALGDQGTENFLQDLIAKHEKIAWMLRATASA